MTGVISTAGAVECACRQIWAFHRLAPARAVGIRSRTRRAACGRGPSRCRPVPDGPQPCRARHRAGRKSGGAQQWPPARRKRAGLAKTPRADGGVKGSWLLLGESLVPPPGLLLVPRPVVAQDSERLMQWSLPALGATGRAACDLDVAAAGCARWPAIAWPPVDGYRAGLPRVTEAALLWEARKPRVPWPFHKLHSNI